MLALIQKRCVVASCQRASSRWLSNEPRAFSRKKADSSGPMVSHFSRDIDEVFAALESTFRPLLALNKDFELIVKPGTEVRLKVGNSDRGHYVFMPNYDTELLRVNSPYSGSFEYICCPDTKNWLCVIDRHDMRGIITRDLLKHCIGCPQFP
jgi:hypothetical protein